EKEKMKVEAAQKKLDAAVALREQSAHAKWLAAQEKQAAASKKRAATIAAKKAALSGKAHVSPAKPTRATDTFAEPQESRGTNAKVKQEKVAAQERIAKARAELKAAELAFTAETGLELTPEAQDDPALREEEDEPVEQESTAVSSGEQI